MPKIHAGGNFLSPAYMVKDFRNDGHSFTDRIQLGKIALEEAVGDMNQLFSPNLIDIRRFTCPRLWTSVRS